jgi:hypothetical protein
VEKCSFGKTEFKGLHQYCYECDTCSKKIDTICCLAWRFSCHEKHEVKMLKKINKWVYCDWGSYKHLNNEFKNNNLLNYWSPFENPCACMNEDNKKDLSKFNYVIFKADSSLMKDSSTLKKVPNKLIEVKFRLKNSKKQRITVILKKTLQTILMITLGEKKKKWTRTSLMINQI